MNANHDRRQSPADDRRIDDIRAGLDALAARAEALRAQWRFLRVQTGRRAGIERGRARRVIRLARIGEANASRMLDSAIGCLVALGRDQIARCADGLAEYGRRQRYDAAIDRLATATILGASAPGGGRRRRHHRP